MINLIIYMMAFTLSLYQVVRDYKKRWL